MLIKGSNHKRSFWNIHISSDYRISANSFRGNYSFLEVGVRKLFKGGKYSREETILFLKKSEVETWILVAVKNWLHAWKIQWPQSNFVWILRLKAVLLPTKSTTVLFDNTLTSEDIMAASVNIFRGRDILKMQKFVQKLHEIWSRPTIVFLIVVVCLINL